MRQHLFRRADDVCHPEDDGLAVLAGADQLPDPVCRIGPRLRGTSPRAIVCPHQEVSNGDKWEWVRLACVS